MSTRSDLELGCARLSAILGPCWHADAVPVESSVTGEILAALCPDCGRQLPVAWLTDQFARPRTI